ncbi:TIGR03089 family protein [Actinoplanes derwentensis]|uniref:TIGR03089 family protein n=1 Tax=Actinoplanes derwentensis TaxID=113562 RepID=A0A1H2CHL4_9ACTN|nr:TIGR03089 family protein [Actinoplanes derwentensis]GID88698.1 acyl-CoA synthetase [Actinoplanes derwentensis]SDT70020.1 TIGR03089 family protein [Actinoplanes derwentensis]
MKTTIPQVFTAAIGRDPAAPLLTWYDDATGDRTELSGITLDNWVQKTANLLVDGIGLGHGDAVALLLPPHWQTAALLLGVSAAGLAADLDGDPQPVEALFTTPERAGVTAGGWATTDRYVTGLLPLAMPLRTVPEGFVDYVIEVRNYGDHFRGEPVAAADRALAGPVELSHDDVVAAAHDRAAELGITPGARVLIDTAALPDPIDWLLAPLVAGASIVLCANLDPTKTKPRAATEKVTLTLV